jgi:hypothetical protein
MAEQSEQLQYDAILRYVNVRFSHLCALGNTGQFHNIAYMGVNWLI